MGGVEEQIAAEIRALRKGRGINAPDLDRRIGRHLRELAGTAGSGLGPLRRALAAELTSAAAELATDLRTAALASLGLTEQTRQLPHFEDRVGWLAAHIGFGQRTALRRIGQAERLLAESVAQEMRRRKGRPSAPPAGWYLDELRTILRLDTTGPEALEHRRIVANRDGLDEVMAWLDVPRERAGSPPLSGEVSYGGRLLRREHPAGDRFHFIVQLPRPLRAGESYEYGLLLRPGQLRRPHYIFTPEIRCDRFRLRVRFDLERLPRWVRRVEAETVRMFDSGQPSGDLIVPDQAGEIDLEFNNPTMYLGYGAQWLP